MIRTGLLSQNCQEGKGNTHMKESIYTIPLMDAFNAKDECPFCFLEREAEQHAIEFILGAGASYMEDDIRADTDKNGFCRHHYKMMYDYGNRLGASLILGTHFKKLNEELKKQVEEFKPQKTSFLNRMKKTNLSMMESTTNIGHWVDEKLSICYVCDHFRSNYERYLDTFFDMYKSNPDFAKLFQESKGFCLPHFKDLVETAEKKLNDKQKESFYPVLFRLMEENMKRLEDEVNWFAAKNDYLNKDKDWGNSRDSVQRCMQKAAGGYPADPVFKIDY